MKNCQKKTISPNFIHHCCVEQNIISNYQLSGSTVEGRKLSEPFWTINLPNLSEPILTYLNLYEHLITYREIFLRLFSINLQNKHLPSWLRCSNNCHSQSVKRHEELVKAVSCMHKTMARIPIRLDRLG